jgi:hypothetical protein
MSMGPEVSVATREAILNKLCLDHRLIGMGLVKVSLDRLQNSRTTTKLYNILVSLSWRFLLMGAMG